MTCAGSVLNKKEYFPFLCLFTADVPQVSALGQEKQEVHSDSLLKSH